MVAPKRPKPILTASGCISKLSPEAKNIKVDSPKTVVIEVKRTGLSLWLANSINSSFVLLFLIKFSISKVSFITIPTSPTKPNKDENAKLNPNKE